MRSILRTFLLAVVLLAIALPGIALAAGPGSTLLVSRPDGLGPLPAAFDNDSQTPGSLSDDGRYAVFVSEADCFAPGGDPTVRNIFVRDTGTGTTTLVSRSDGPGGAGANADSQDPDVTVSASGDVLVAFTTAATNLSDHATGPVTPPADTNEVWMRDVTTGTTTLISRAGANGAPADRESRNPSIGATDGGPVVAFDSSAHNLGATVRNGGVYLRTVAAGVAALVSCKNKDCGGTPSADDSIRPDLRVVLAAPRTPCPPVLHPSGSCVLIAFDTIDSTISGSPIRQVVLAAATAPGASGTATSAPKAYITVSAKAGGTFGNSFSQIAKLSADGMAVAFSSAATNLTADTIPPRTSQLYVWRFSNGSFELLSKAAEVANDSVRSLALGGDVDHLRAAFSSLATNLGGQGLQVYLRDVPRGTTALLNRAPGAGGAPSGGETDDDPALSADGSAALFGTFARDAGDRFQRVRVRRLDDPAEPVELVSRPDGTGPLPAFTDDSFLAGNASTSADGRYVAFTSSTDGLTADAAPGVRNVYVRDLLSERTVLVSRASGAAGAGADGNSVARGISADGRKVVFQSSAGNLSGDAVKGVQSVYVRDLDAGTTRLVSRASGASGAASGVAGASAGPISADGGSVVFTSSAALDPAGVDGQSHVYVRNLAAGTTTLVDRDSGVAGTVPAVGSFEPAISADGSRVAWVSPAAIAGAATGGKQHVFLRDLGTHVTSLVSRADGPDGAAFDGAAFEPALDAGGDVVAFEACTPDAGTMDSSFKVYVRNVGTGHTELVSVPPPGGGTPFVEAFSPSLDAAGDRVSYTANSSSAGAAGFQIFVRDLPSETTSLVSRADGLDGAPDESSGGGSSSITASGDCVAFDGAFPGLGDGFGSADFSAVHMRVLRGACPVDGGGGSPPPPPPPPPPPGAPVLSKLTVTPGRFRVVGRVHGTTIRYKLSRAARVTLKIDRLTRVGRRLRVHRAGVVAAAGRRGANKLRFSGKLRGKRLAPGTYRLTATPSAGRARTAKFTVLRPKRR